MSLLKPLCVGALTVGVVSLAAVATRAQGKAPDTNQGSSTTDAQIDALVKDAYIYGYPLVTMEMTRRQMTNFAKPTQLGGPMGQFANKRKYPTAEFKEVTAPNADTLYSAAWLDLSKDAMVLEIPEMGNRYYLMPMLDAWTNVISDPGTRATGTKPQKYVLSGPNFHEAIPAGLTEIKSPTALLWIIGRTYSSGTPADYKEVHALQDQYKLMPLSAYNQGGKYVPPAGKVDPSIDMKTAPRDQVNALSGEEYFTLLATLLKDNPPSAADGPMVSKLAKLGIVPGQPFDIAKADPKVVSAMKRAPKVALAEIQKTIERVPMINGWAVSKTGQYGTAYLARAGVTYFGLGANRSEDAIYPTAKTDAAGKPLDASTTSYVMTFKSAKDLPPVRGFWSLTMYDSSMFFVNNALNRYTISSRDKLVPNKDGTITVYFQNKSPGKDKEANWLPAPSGPFVVMLRMYWPTESPPSILDGSWKPPGIEPAPTPQAKAEPVEKQAPKQ